MSKIGQSPIPVSSSVQVTINEREITVKGSKGQHQIIIPHTITVEQEGENLIVKRKNESKKVRSLHGLYRSMINNAVVGVDKGWEKRLEITGTGYNVKLQGQDLAFKVGYSHLVIYKPVAGVQFKVEGNNKVSVTGIDKQLVGQVAYQIKSIKKPDAYKGKGIRYEGEVIKTKVGKKAKA